jgi:hypothetical protein
MRGARRRRRRASGCHGSSFMAMTGIARYSIMAMERHGQGTGHTCCEGTRMSKYDPLRSFLNTCGGAALTMSFAEVESVLGFELPWAATHFRQWWGNNASGHAQSRSWMLARYKVDTVDFEAQTVDFIGWEQGPSMLDSGKRRIREKVAPARSL